MSYNSQRNGEQAKKKWVVVIAVITFFAGVAGLVIISVASFFQTLQAFLPLNDPTIVLWGLPLGNQIAFSFALVFQYGQNIALFVKANYTTGKKIADFGIFELTDTMLCNIVFGVCASIDAGTNIMWLNSQVDVAGQALVFRILEYVAMIAIVFVEEVLGIAIQGLSHSLTDLKKIKLMEGKSSVSHDSGRDRRPVQQPAGNSGGSRDGVRSYVNNNRPKPYPKQPSPDGQEDFHTVGD